MYGCYYCYWSTSWRAVIISDLFSIGVLDEAITHCNESKRL